MSQPQKQPDKKRLPVIAAFISFALLFVMVIVSAVLGRKLHQSEAACMALEKEITDRDALIADRDARIADQVAQIADRDAQIADRDAQIADRDAQIADKSTQIKLGFYKDYALFDSGKKSYIDIDGDGQEEIISVCDIGVPEPARTRLSASFPDGRCSSIDFEGWFSSTFATGDLNGDRSTDILLVLAYIGSNHGAITYKTLHFEDGQWKEFPDTFLSNPEINELQPTDFGISFFCIDATIIEGVNGNLLRTIWHDANDNNLGAAVKYKVRCVDASCRDEGWYVENVQVIDDYYAPGVRESVIPSQL